MKYQNILSDNEVQCKVCPRQCILEPEQSGFCHVRKNVGGEIKSTTYGCNTGLNIDPIEKKPLYHFYPSSKVLSFGTLGCNIGCAFCQNWHLSRSKENPEDFVHTLPEKIVQTAIDNNCKSIAYTYNDPIIFLEYVMDTAKIARENGIKNVAVTAGYMNPGIHEDFFKYMDAVNVDLKAFNEEFYRKNCFAHLEPVLKTIKYIKHETDAWLELTTLLINGENDSVEDITKECEWMKENLGVHVPLHFSAFYPAYKFKDRLPTKPETLIRAYDIAKEIGLKYVYTGNIRSEDTSTTYCENCGNKIILRNAYVLTGYNLTSGGHCKFCGHRCHGVFE